MSTPPLNIREASVAAAIDLLILETELQSTPEPLYIWTNYVSTKYGPKQTRKGSRTQVNRLLPLESPDPDNLAAYIAGTGRNALDITDNSNLQSLNWSEVVIQVQRRRMPKPVSEKFETEQLSQQDIMLGHRINLRRNYHEYLDDLVREEYRSHVCTNIFGNSLRTSSATMLNAANTDGLGTTLLKEFKRRASLLHIRPFGSVPGSDMQALAGSFLAITDQVGINELTADQLWRDYIIRNNAESAKVIKGFVAEYEQITVVKSERMRSVTLGPSGSTFAGHEIIFTASDPVMIDPGEDGVQGFVGENPVVLAMLGMPEVKKASEDNFGEDLIYDWFHTLGIQALEELTGDQATALTAILGGNLDTSKGVAATGASRYIHRGYFV